MVIRNPCSENTWVIAESLLCAPSSDMPGVGYCRSWEHRHEALPVIRFLEGGLGVLHRAAVRQLDVDRLQTRDQKAQ